VTLAGKKGKVMADQNMAATKSWLKSQRGTISKEGMLAVEDAILIHLGLPK
jgi:mRNA interferase MazF